MQIIMTPKNYVIKDRRIKRFFPKGTRVVSIEYYGELPLRMECWGDGEMIEPGVERLGKLHVYTNLAELEERTRLLDYLEGRERVASRVRVREISGLQGPEVQQVILELLCRLAENRSRG